MATGPMKSSPTPEMVRYSLAWRNPHTQPPGPRVLHAVLVTRGEKCPQEILDLWSPGCGYAVTWELVTQRPIRRWSKEARARVRRRNLERNDEQVSAIRSDLHCAGAGEAPAILRRRLLVPAFCLAINDSPSGLNFERFSHMYFYGYFHVQSSRFHHRQAP
jgi:hypothetical protein